MKNILLKLSELLTKRDKNLIIKLFFFSLFISVLETVGISAIMPFIAVATDFQVIHTNQYYNQVYTFLGLTQESHFIILFGIVLITFYLFRSLINLTYFYALNRFTRGRTHLLAFRVFKNYMGMPYKNFITKNSSVINKTIITEVASLTALISALLFMVSEIFVVIFIYAMLFYINYKITIALTLFLFLNALLMLKTVSVKIKEAGLARERTQKFYFEILNRSLANFKIIKLQSNTVDVLNEFEKHSHAYAKVHIKNSTLEQVPRLFLEAIGFSIIISIVIYLVWENGNDISSALAMITMFILALYRLMPSVNRIMTSYNQVLFNSKSLEVVHRDLMYNSEVLGNEDIKFQDKIFIKNLNFEYSDKKRVLSDINIVIETGSKIAFVGESGSGKSTLVDIIIGLHKPTTGTIMIDNTQLDYSNVKRWRQKIGYIPQSIYLFDGTVAENISFGFEYNKEKVDECLKKAKIYDFLDKKDGQETLVGEGGVMLSGGQKQRIAIARALYGDPELIVLDEATSALDDETETMIMEEIYNVSQDKTLIIIAHRLSTLDKCEKIYRLENGKIVN